MEKVFIFSNIITVLLFIYPAWKLFSMYFKYFIRYMFCLPNYWWNPEVERPRLLFILGSIIFIGFSAIFNTIGDALIIRIIASLFYAVGLLVLYFVWSKGFEKKFIGQVKAKLLGNRIKSVYSKGYDLEGVLQEFKFLNCNIDTFEDLLTGNKIADEKKIICGLDKRKLIRFIFILFGFKQDVSNETIKSLVSHYFLEKSIDNKPYSIQEKASEISTIRAEIIQEIDIFISFQEEIIAVFQAHKITEP